VAGIAIAVWTALDGFDPQFFMYGEEADLCLRARRLGASPMVTPDATIIHHGGASEKTKAGKMVKLLVAKATLIDRHWDTSMRRAGQKLLALWPLSRWIALSITAGISRSAHHRQAASVWRQIWQARAVWWSGYEALPSICGADLPTPLMRELPLAS
jgi:N-acetylglucosaminyl-diphospho-decaprenol L-rhamnosyltransferase